MNMDEKRGKSRSFRDLDVWKISVDFAKDIYQLSQKFPSYELYGLTNQIRRAVISIPSNIAEGQSRNSFKEFKHFLSIALGSLGEVETQLVIDNKIEYVTDKQLEICISRLDTIRKMLKALAAKVIS